MFTRNLEIETFVSRPKKYDRSTYKGELILLAIFNSLGGCILVTINNEYDFSMYNENIFNNCDALLCNAQYDEYLIVTN